MVIKKIAVLFSGAGSNLEKILEKVHGKTFATCKIEVVKLISNNPNALGIQKAKAFGLPTTVIDHKKFDSREAFDTELVRILKQSDLDLVVLAGFMRILSSVFTQNIRAINLHPSLLPLFKGGNAIEESFKSSMRVGGVSVHFVSDELDGGEIIAQKCFAKTKEMSLEAFEQKIHSIEHELLPQTIIQILDKEEK